MSSLRWSELALDLSGMCLLVGAWDEPPSGFRRRQEARIHGLTNLLVYSSLYVWLLLGEKEEVSV